MFDQAVAAPTIDVICDLRQAGRDVDNLAELQRIWPDLARLLVGRTAIAGQSFSITLTRGVLLLWVVRVVNAVTIDRTTTVNIIDVIRNPAMLYTCIHCGLYGPFRCEQSTDRETPERLCGRCTHFIKDELKAYCRNHLPRCRCQPGCRETASFRCTRCRRIYGTHAHRAYPHEALADLCQSCHLYLFEPCADCLFGTPKTGKSRCIFKLRTDARACDRPLCIAHSLQWRVWGPHYRGLTLCQAHHRALMQTGALDLLHMILTAPALELGRGRVRRVPRPFSLRRVVNRHLQKPYSFEELHRIIVSLKPEVAQWGRRAGDNYQELINRFNQALTENGQAEARLLPQIKAWYERRLGRRAAEQIQTVKVIDCFFRPDSPPHYKLRAELPAQVNRWQFIQTGGRIIEQLGRDLNITLEIVAGGGQVGRGEPLAGWSPSRRPPNNGTG